MKRALVVFILLSPALLEAHKPTTTRFTYHRDVRPIFERKCGSCHRGGGIAPMSLLSYKDAYPWAVAIKNRVLALSMPPWFADERYGAFRHPSALTAGELNTIVDWCLGGTPEGARPDAAPLEPQSSQSSPPDVVLELPQPFVLQPESGEAFHEVTFSRVSDRERFLKAIEFQPQSANVVRSALVFLAPKGQPIFSWLPGQEADAWPPGYGVRIPVGASLVLRLHYKKTWLDEGKEVSDRSRIGLYFTEKKAMPVNTLTVASKGGSLVVEPVPGKVELLALLPRVEAPLDSLLVEAILPDGEIRKLLRLREPAPEWPRKYWLEKPVLLPKGARIQLTLAAEGEGALAASHALVLDVVARR